MASPAADIDIPELVIEEELGRGAYSVVYRARHRGRACAVKISRTRGRASRWFRREAAALARVRHEGVPAVLDIGELDKRPFLIMELVEGHTLTRRLAHGPLTHEEAIILGLRLASIVAAIHVRGLVHRDVKPDNIVIEDSGSVRLVDFGLVTQLHLGAAPADAAGTRTYAAPEQHRAPQFVDARADLFAIGKVLAEAVGSANGPVPGPLGTVVSHLLQEAPDKRYPSASALIVDLERVRASATPLGPEASVHAVTEPEAIVLVGREKELEQLRAGWEAARGGRGGVLLLEGPPGSGKTRLLRELVALASRDAICFDAQGQTQLPLATLRQLFDRHLSLLDTKPPEVRDALHDAWREAAKGPATALVGSLSPRFGRILGGQTTPSEREHEAFVEAIAATMVRLARSAGPVLVCIDDLQWLDPVSREVLVRVALGAAEVPLLFVVAARTDARSVPPIERFVRTLGKDRLEIISVRPLSSSDSDEFVGAYLGLENGESVDAALNRRVVGLSDGTPLGTLEILGALIDGGALMPHWGRWRFDAQRAEQIPLSRGAAVLLHRRLDALPPATVQVLQTAAVIGPRFEHRRVARVVGVEIEDLGLALFEAGRAGLIELDRAGRPQFVHESVREALVASLSDEHRRALHQRVAEVLDAEGADQPDILFAIAHHFARGEPRRNPERVYTVARAAGEKAAASLDHETGLEFFDLARSAARNASLQLDTKFHREAAECRIRAGALDDALEDLQCALERAESTERVVVLSRIAWVHQLKAEPDRAWMVLERAFSLLREPMPVERPRVVARSLLLAATAKLKARTVKLSKDADRDRLALLCALHYQNARLGVEYDKPLRTLQSALTILRIGEYLGPSPTMARALAMYGMFMAILGRRGAGSRFLARAEAMAEHLDDPACTAQVLQFGCVTACFVGDIDRALVLGRRCLDTYGHWIEVTDYCLVAGSLQLIESVRGRPREALAWLERALSRVRRHGKAPSVVAQVIAPELRAVLATLGRGDASSYLELLDGEAEADDGRGFYRMVTWGPRALLLAEARAEDAEVDALVREFDAEGYGPRRAHLTLVIYYVAIAQVRVQQCIRAGGESRTELLEKLDRALADLRKAARVPLFRAHLDVLEGYRGLLRGDLSGARRRFESAKVQAERETSPWVLYLVARGEAHLLRREGREDAALDQARVAALLAREHGAMYRLRCIEEEFGLQPASSADARSRRSSSSSLSTRGRQLRALSDVVRAAAREQQVEPQARVVLDELLRLTSAWRGLVLFARNGEGSSRVFVGREREGGAWEVVHTEHHDRLQKVCDTGQSDPPPRNHEDEEDGERSEEVHNFAIPLELHTDTIGALYLERGPGESPFSCEEIDLVMTLAPQVAMTLELARLLEERERLQSSLRQAQKMEAVGQLASGIAHDFNNSLMAISSAVGELERSRPLGEGDSDVVEIIRGSCDRAATLTRQLLAFSRRQVLEFTTMDAVTTVAELVPMLRRLIGEGIELKTERLEKPCWVKTDRPSLEHAIVNLVVNARDAMPDGGKISLGVSEVDLDEAWLPRGASKTGPHVRIAVEDTGSGIPPEILDRIFDPFYTTKKVGDGTGLGLASVYGFVKQSGGCVDVYSKVGVGSEFSVYLPAAEGSSVVATTSPARDVSSVSSRRAVILLVDDEPLVRRALERTLRGMGYEVKTAANGSEAIETLAREGPVDLVIADVLMPIVSGPELAAHLAESGLAIPILFISGYPDGALVHEGVLREGVDFLQKPFPNEELEKRVAVLLGGKSRRPQNESVSPVRNVQ